MNDDSKHPQSLVIACGNRSRGDDALGARVVELLNAMPVQGLRALDLGCRPDLLIDLLDGVDLLIVVDAMRIPAVVPGTIVQLDWPTLRQLTGSSEGTHGLNLIDQLHFAHRLGILPPIVQLMGVAIEQTGIEEPLTPLIEQRAAEVAQRILKFIQLQFVKARTVQ